MLGSLQKFTLPLIQLFPNAQHCLQLDKQYSMSFPNACETELHYIVVVVVVVKESAQLALIYSVVDKMKKKKAIHEIKIMRVLMSARV